MGSMGQKPGSAGVGSEKQNMGGPDVKKKLSLILMHIEPYRTQVSIVGFPGFTQNGGFVCRKAMV